MRRFRSGIVAALLLWVLAAGAADAEDGVIPLGGTVQDAILLHVTAAGWQFVESAAVQVLEGMDIEGMIMEQNPLAEGSEAGCDYVINATGVDFGPIQVDISHLPFPGQPTLPQSIYFQIVIPSPRIDIRVDYDCWWPIGGGDEDATATADYIKANAVVQVVYNDTPEGGRLGIEISHLQAFLEGLDLSFDNWFLDFIVGLFEATIENEVNGIISDILFDQLLPMLEELLEDIPLSGEIPVEALGTAIVYDITIDQLTHTAEGFTIEFEGSVYIDGQSDCVDLGSEPGSRWTNNPLPTLGSTAPNGQAYHVALMVADDILNQAAYSAFASGLLCQDIDESILGGFGVQNLARLVPALVRQAPPAAAADDDTGDDDTETPEPPEEGDSFFRLRPEAPPIIDFGDGNPDLIVASIQDLGIGMWEFTQERWIRTLGLLVDLRVGLNFELVGNVITLLISDPQIDFEITYNEYSGLDEEQVQALIDTVLEVAWPLLLEAIGDGFELPVIELPSGHVLGYQLNQATRLGEGNDFLGIFLSFTLSTPGAAADTFLVLRDAATGARRAESDVALDAAQSARYGLADALHLEVEAAALPDEPGTEFSYRLDGGFWSRFSADPTIRLRTFEGRHLLEVRARTAAGDVDPTPARLVFTADGVAPVIVGLSADDEVTAGEALLIDVQARDFQTAPDRIRYSFRVDGGEWSEPAAAGRLRVPGLAAGEHMIGVRAVDAAGNVSPESALPLTVVEDGARFPFGCGATGAGGGLAGLGLAVSALALWRRMRKGS